jgi:hypothetical protein
MKSGCEPFDGIEGQSRLGSRGLLVNPVPEVFDGWSPVGVDLAKRAATPLGPEQSMGFRVGRTPRA